MATINTPEDWWNLAKTTIPLLPAYAAEFKPVQEDILAALLSEAFEARNYVSLHTILQDVYDFLPDSSDIRKAPFFDLCDLCSEVWVFDDAKTETES